MDDAWKRGFSIAAGAAALFLAGRAVARRLRRFDFHGSTVLITGGSRGFGLVLARQLAAEGARLVICARDADELDRAAADLVARGADVLPIVCDVTEPDDVNAMINRIVGECGGIDVVINNAGIIQSGPYEVMTCEDYEEALRVHLFGPIAVNRAVIPAMKQRGGGRIVNIASIGGLVGVPHRMPYCASKFALVGYSLTLRAEAAKDGIVVTTVCPGVMRTGSPRNATFKGQNEAEYASFKIASSLPVLSINAERAARQALDACRFGDALVVLGGPARLFAKFAAMFPGLASDLLAASNRLMPEAGGIGTRRKPGYASETWLSESPLTALTDRAALENNEHRPSSK